MEDDSFNQDTQDKLNSQIQKYKDQELKKNLK